jgi:hypothetical protein
MEIVFYLTGKGSYITFEIKLNGAFVREDIFALPPNHRCYGSHQEVKFIIEEGISPSLFFHPTIGK